MIKSFGWELCDHPPNSPYLVPSDYHFFRYMKTYQSVARSFVTWAPHGSSDVLKYAGHPSDVRRSHEDASFHNAPTTSDKLEDKQRCRNDKPIMSSTQTCKTVDGKYQARS
ncbi:hypothetical protein AVEN_150592-1 [Araneus ventricosus]|uniref:Uncharacterized protein n=1 Tax=Araneus ventricosus TaxID=182803 RepID=A0A4Y2MA48_ARAVE|nr:hypothetical protein AVEN_150592-1 [Araneus ventricosus]